MTSKSIAIITESYYPIIDGVSVFINNHIKSLKDHGYDFVIICPKNPQEDDHGENNNVIRLPSFAYPQYPSYRYFYRGSKRAENKIHEYNIDVIHFMTQYIAGLLGVYFSKKFNIPLIGTYLSRHNVCLDYTLFKICSTVGLKVYKYWIKTIYNRCNLVSTPSYFVAEELKSFNVSKPIEVIPCGSDIKDYMWANEKKRETKILFIGRLSYEKQIDVFIRSFPDVYKERTDIKYIIVGDGPHRKELMKLANKCCNNREIIFLGKVNPSSVPKHLKQTSILVNPCPYESQGLTITMALCMGVPVIAADGAAISEIIQHKYNGYLFRPGDHKQLAKYILELLSNDNLSSLLSKNEIMSSSKYQIATTSKQWINTYQNIIMGSG